MSDDLVRLRPSLQAPAVSDDISRWWGLYLDGLEVEREALAIRMRYVESVLIENGRITRVLCAPGRVK